MKQVLMWLWWLPFLGSSRAAPLLPAFAGPIPPPPPLSLPVWSLACCGSSGVTSMNIVTFATAVSVAAPKLWIVSLYYGTATKDAFLEAGGGVLQLLQPAQKHLVEVLGKHSSYAEPEYSKSAESAKIGFAWTSGDWSEAKLLPDCASYIRLRTTGDTIEAGDHVAVLCEVTGTGSWNGQSVVNVEAMAPTALDNTVVLYTGRLREEGIL